MLPLSKKILILAGLVLIGGCSTKVSRVQSNSTIDLTGKWNDADSRLVAEEMINDCLQQRWLYKYETENKTYSNSR